MDLTTRIQVVVGGNAEQAKEALQEVKKGVKDLSQANKKEGKESGNELGEQWGKGYAKATDKWLKFVSKQLKEHFGVFGKIVGSSLDFGRKFNSLAKSSMGKAADVATDVASNAAGGVVSNTITQTGNEQGSEFAQNAAANAAGNVVSSAPGKVAGKVLKKGLGLTAGALGLTAGVVAAIAGFGALAIKFATAREEAEKMAASFNLATNVFTALKDDQATLDIFKKYGGDTFLFVKELEKIKSPVQQATAAIQLFGKEGIEEMHKMQEAVEKYNKAQEKTNFQTEANAIAWKITGAAIRDNILKPISNAVSNVGTKALGLLSGVSADDAKEIMQQEQLHATLQHRLDQTIAGKAKKAAEEAEAKAKKAIEDKAKLKKINEDMKDERLKELSIIGQIVAQEQQLLELQMKKTKSKVEEKENELAIYKIKSQLAKDYKTASASGAKATLADLASMNGTYSGAAKSIASYETNANVNANMGRWDLAARGRERANYVRNYLGQVRGVLSSEEYEGYKISPQQQKQIDLMKKVYGRPQSVSEVQRRLFEDYIRYGALPVLPRMGK